MAALGKSIMSFFTGPAIQQGQQGQVTTQQHAATNATVPGPTEVKSDGSIAAIPKAAEGSASPLANYKDMWDKSANPVQEPSLVPSMNVDPQAIQNVARGVNFVGAIDPALVEKAQKGDNSAFMQVINQAVQAGYASSAGATAKIVEDALKKQEKIFNEQVMPGKLRQHEITQKLAIENPIFNDPAARPILEAVKNQLNVKYPTASPEEIAQHAKQYLTGFAQTLVTGSGQQIVSNTSTKEGTGRNTEDWGAYFGEDASGPIFS